MFHISKFTFNPFQENTYVIHDGKEAILVDPGCWNSSEEHELETYFEENGLTPVRLVLTHSHVDHVMGCAWAEKRYRLLPELHADAVPLLHAAERTGRMYGVHCEPPPEPRKFLKEGEIVALGNARMEVLFTPGHAPGHIVFHCKEQAFAIVGDVLFMNSIGRTDLPGGDTDTLLQSIQEQLLPLPDDTVVYSGHGPETTIGKERRSNPFLRGLGSK